MVPASVDVGNDPVAHSPAVLVPRRAVLPPALGHVPGVPVHQQDDEVDHVVPGQQVAEACRGEPSTGSAQQQQQHMAACETVWPETLTAGQRPGQSHQQVSQVVGVAHHAPPARHQQALPCGCGDALQVWTGHQDSSFIHKHLLKNNHGPVEASATYGPVWGLRGSSGSCSSQSWMP